MASSFKWRDKEVRSTIWIALMVIFIVVATPFFIIVQPIFALFGRVGYVRDLGNGHIAIIGDGAFARRKS